jgi:hypothetical protein
MTALKNEYKLRKLYKSFFSETENLVEPKLHEWLFDGSFQLWALKVQDGCHSKQDKAMQKTLWENDFKYSSLKPLNRLIKINLTEVLLKYLSHFDHKVK